MYDIFVSHVQSLNDIANVQIVMVLIDGCRCFKVVKFIPLLTREERGISWLAHNDRERRQARTIGFCSGRQ